jgi:protein-disulfide isomerase
VRDEADYLAAQVNGFLKVRRDHQISAYFFIPNEVRNMSRPPVLVLLPILLFLSPMFGQSEAEMLTMAEVNGERISLQDLKQASGERLAVLEQQAYRLKQQKLEQMIGDRLLANEARRRKIALESLIDTEITSKAAAVTVEEIHSVYELNKNQLRKPESEVEEQLRALLRDQKIVTRRQEFVRSLQSQAKVNIYLTPPSPFRADVNGEGPSRGAADAPITIVEFEDFQCPFCKRAQDALEHVLVRYEHKVRLVHRDFPLQSLHAAAWKAHEAGRCAEEQGKFWEYRDLLYKNAPAASPEQLDSYASQTGMNVPVFKQCLESGKFRAVVQKDEDEGDRLGVEGTPAFFINGRRLSGAQPESEFTRLIDEELNKRAQR